MARLWLVLVGVSVFCFFCIDTTSAVAVMSVDLGSEWMKIAIVSPGVPMEIVLNKESKRKTPVAMSFRDWDREFGENAVAMSSRFPEKVYRFVLDLLGKKADNPMVKLYKDRFPFYNIVADDERQTIVFKQDENTSFTPEELLAMILEKARELAQHFAGQPVKEAVITVPPFFNQAERRSVVAAANLAGLKVLQLMSDNAAVALNYGIFRHKDFNATQQQRILFYDMGSSSTKATIVGYQVVKIKEKGFVESHPQLNILGFGYDRTLGGFEMTLRLREYLAKKFSEQKLTTTNVFTNQRAMAKLLKEADRLKMVLSANNDHVAQVESLLDDKDFKQPVSRADFEELCKDLFERASKPIEDALKSASLTTDDIDQVILVGAGTRVPRVQEEVMRASKKTELGKNLNTDEAAALGAVYQAAHLGQGFKVKRFIVKEAVLFPVQVSFDRQLDGSEGSGTRVVTRTLFGLLNQFPQKKVMTFNRHVTDFDLNVSYTDPSSYLSAKEQGFFGTSDITKITLTGVAEALSKHRNEQSEHKGIKAHFRMDDSGILTLDQVECIFEKTIVDDEVKDDESPLSKFGSTLSNLFRGTVLSSNDKDPTDEGEHEEESASETNDETSEKPKEDKMPVENSTTDGRKDVNQSKTATGGAPSNETITLEAKMKTEIVKEKLRIQETKTDIPELSAESIATAQKKLQEYDKKEREKNDREEAHNSLESFIIDTQDKLYQKEYEASTTEQERENTRNKLSEASDWLDEEGMTATAKAFKTKLSDLKTVTKAMFDRVKEHRERPDAVAALKEMLNVSTYFLAQARNASKDDQYFTAVELDTLEKLIVSTREWAAAKETEQKLTELFKTPILTVRSIHEKLAALDREVKYLINKARISKPKPPKVEKNESEESSNGASTEGAEEVEEEEEDEEEESRQTESKGDESKRTEEREETEEKTPEMEAKNDTKRGEEEEHSEL